MRKLFGSVIDTRGRPVENATVTITTYPGGGGVTLFSDNGVTQTANPLTTNPDGLWQGYLAAGNYTFTIRTANTTIILNDYKHDA